MGLGIPLPLHQYMRTPDARAIMPIGFIVAATGLSLRATAKRKKWL